MQGTVENYAQRLHSSLMQQVFDSLDAVQGVVAAGELTAPDAERQPELTPDGYVDRSTRSSSKKLKRFYPRNTKTGMVFYERQETFSKPLA